MKKCRVNPEMLSRLLDGDVVGKDANLLRGHVETCKRCRTTYAAWLRQRELVNAAFSSRPLPPSVFAMMAKAKPHPVYGAHTWFFRFAVPGIAVTAAVCVALLVPQDRRVADNIAPPSVIIESQTPATMLHPLSALAYYEDMAGESVHSQFVALTPRTASGGILTDEGCVRAAYHTSQIFFDNALQTRSAAVTQGAYDNGE